MRKWITLIENARPNAASIITDNQYIRDIMASGTWVAHGSHIEDIFHANNIPDDPMAQKEFLQSWLPKRAERIEEHLSKLKPHDVLARAMYVPDHWVADLSDPATISQVGIFFSSGDESAYPYGDIDQEGHLVYVFTTLGDATVDWVETIKSRADYKHGDEEFEIQLVKGSIINNISVSDEMGNDYPVAPGKKFIA